MFNASQNYFAACDDVREHGNKRFAQLRLRPHAPGPSWTRGDDEHRFASKARCERRARRPVKRVLQNAVDAVVVLGCGDDHAVTRSHVGTQSGDRWKLWNNIQVLDVKRDVSKGPYSQRDVFKSLIAKGAQDGST